MKTPPQLRIPCPRELSDQTVAELLDLLYDIACAIENHYAAQLHRYYHDTVQQHETCDDNPGLPDPPF
jgi:hypothetical protein